MISILICTRNRADILPFCLHSFADQSANQNFFEVVVIDNNSSDKTREVTLTFAGKIRNLRCISEDQVGLSHARNKGFAEAKFEWVSYVDDDARAYPDYVERAIWVIKNYDFDCFGGRFFPWYLDTKPKWLSDDFGLFPCLLQQVGELPPDRDVAGGVIVFRKSTLSEIGGFPVNLGMSGNEVGYGEENWVQRELRKRSYKMGFDPELKIDHLVASYKFTLRWHLRRMYAKGRTERMLNMNTGENKVCLISKAVLYTLKELLFNIVRLLFKRGYYFQNYALDSVGFLVKMWGYIGTK